MRQIVLAFDTDQVIDAYMWVLTLCFEPLGFGLSFSAITLENVTQRWSRHYSWRSWRQQTCWLLATVIRA